MTFDGLKYNLRSIPTDKVFSKYPELYQIYSEVLAMYPGEKNPHPPLTAEQAISLVTYTYHQSSPLVRQYPNMHTRRKEALKLLAFTLESAEDLVSNEGILPFIVGSNAFVNHLAIHFCKFENNSSKWTELCRKQDMLDDVFLVLKDEQSGTEKKSATEMLALKIKLEQQAEGLQTKINQLSAEIFSGDTELTPLAAAYVIMEKRKPVISVGRYVTEKRLKTVQ